MNINLHLQYTFLLLMVFLMEGVAGILAYVYEEQVMDELSYSMLDTFSLRYHVDDTATTAIDKMQIEVSIKSVSIDSMEIDSLVYERVGENSFLQRPVR